MKKWMVTAVMLMFLLNSFASQSNVVRKDDRKQEKMDKKMVGRENAKRNNNGKKSLRKLHKMEKKESKL